MEYKKTRNNSGCTYCMYKLTHTNLQKIKYPGEISLND